MYIFLSRKRWEKIIRSNYLEGLCFGDVVL